MNRRSPVRHTRLLGAASVTMAVVVVLIAVVAAPAHACSCVGSTDAEAFALSDAVFVGEVVDYEPPPARAAMSSADPATWTFAVSDVYKGDVAATQEIVSEWQGASCGLEMPRQGEYLVFATRTSFQMDVGQGAFYAGLCGGTRPVGPEPPAIAATASPPRAVTTTAPSAEREPSQDAPVTGDGLAPGLAPAALATAAAAVALAAVVLLRRRRVASR